MKDSTNESEQWIPWEIAYSLSEYTRRDRRSRSNAILAVVLPDEHGSYEYYLNEHYCSKCNCIIYQTDTLFNILRSNMFNIKNNRAEYASCTETHSYTIYSGEYSYIKSIEKANKAA